MATKKAAGPKVADRARTGKKGAAKRDGATAKALKDAKAEVAANLARLEAGESATGGEGPTGGATTAPTAANATGAAVGRDGATRGKRAKAEPGKGSNRGARKGADPPREQPSSERWVRGPGGYTLRPSG